MKEDQAIGFGSHNFAFSHKTSSAKLVMQDLIWKSKLIIAFYNNSLFDYIIIYFTILRYYYNYNSIYF